MFVKVFDRQLSTTVVYGVVCRCPNNSNSTYMFTLNNRLLSFLVCDCHHWYYFNIYNKFDWFLRDSRNWSSTVFVVDDYQWWESMVPVMGDCHLQNLWIIIFWPQHLYYDQFTEFLCFLFNSNLILKLLWYLKGYQMQYLILLWSDYQQFWLLVLIWLLTFLWRFRAFDFCSSDFDINVFDLLWCFDLFHLCIVIWL